MFSNSGREAALWGSLVRRIETVLIEVHIVLSVQLSVELRLLQLIPVEYHVVTVVVGLGLGGVGPDQFVPGDDVDGGGVVGGAGAGVVPLLLPQVLSQVQLLR